MLMMTMIVEDVAVVAVIALFIWLVPVRRKGIPGLRGRGRVPNSPFAPSARPARPGEVQPRPVPEDEKISAADARGVQAGKCDDRVLAELDRTWDAGYADQAGTQARGHKNSA
jgi:hypothetical protein